MKYAIDKQYRHMCFKFPFNKPWLALSNAVLRPAAFLTLCPRGIRETKLMLGGVKCKMYAPVSAPDSLPVLVYYHGGGFGHLAAPHQKLMACRYAAEVGCAVVMPMCARVPRSRYTEIIGDAVAAYNAVRYIPLCNGKIAVAGDSAGGFQAACVSALAEEKPLLQLLFYPVTDCETESDSMKKYSDTPMWNSVNDGHMWKLFGDENTVTPMHMDGVTSDTYIEVAQFDPLHDQGVAYAEKLRSQGVNVTLADTVGTIHGFDFVKNATVTRECMSRRIELLKKAFERG